MTVPPPHISARASDLLLRTGTTISTICLAAGLVGVFVSPSGTLVERFLTTGLVILMATPVARLIVAIVDECVAREWRFAAIGVLVLALLAGSLALVHLT